MKAQDLRGILSKVSNTLSLPHRTTPHHTLLLSFLNCSYLLRQYTLADIITLRIKEYLLKLLKFYI